MKKRQRYRTIWISDIHLGSRGAQAGELAHFLKRVECDRLYLVGDIIDFWQLKSRVYWPWQHNAVLRRLLQLLKRGTKVIIIPGNHDEALRDYTDVDFGGITIRNTAIHDCVNGRKLLVTHGDKFDLVVTQHKLLSFIGSAAYDWLVVINRYYNRYRRWRHKPYWSLSQYLKLKVKSACTFISHYQESLLHEACENNVDGVVCGHIHKAEVIEGEFTYYNCGDWVESCSALVEDDKGDISIIYAHEFLKSFESTDLADIDDNDDENSYDDSFTENLMRHQEEPCTLVSAN